jgi:glycerophosphoryl diester phosphodiesterase
MLTAEMVAKLHEKKLTVWVWTADEPEAMDNLIAWGIDCITTNSPDVLKARVAAAARKSK